MELLLEGLGAASSHVEAEAGDKLPELFDALLGRGLVHAKKKWPLPRGKLLGHGPVRREHELLDYPVGDVPLGTDYVLDPALYVQDYLRLGQVEVEAPFLEPLLREPLGKLSHEPEVFRYMGVASCKCGVFSFEHRLHVRIGEALRAPYDALVKPFFRDPAAPVEGQLSRQGEPVLAGIEAAYAVREGLGEHGDAAVWEIYARATRVGLGVEAAPLLDVMAHVGYGDEEGGAMRCLLYAHGGVEVFGRLSVHVKYLFF